MTGVKLTEPQKLRLYHITDLGNLESIILKGGLLSDALIKSSDKPSSVTDIGYSHIKNRRLTEIQVNCCGNRFVGEFVPFYFCPRSPMLFTVNKGATGKPPGCQRTIIHLVTTIENAVNQNRDWAFSDVNAGSAYPTFYDDLNKLNQLDWEAIKTNNWAGKTSQKMAEFLVADRFDWDKVIGIGCIDSAIQNEVLEIIKSSNFKPKVAVTSQWYYT